MMNINDQITELNTKIESCDTEIATMQEAIKSKKEEQKILAKTVKQLEEAKAKIDAIYGNIPVPPTTDVPEEVL